MILHVASHHTPKSLTNDVGLLMESLSKPLFYCLEPLPKSLTICLTPYHEIMLGTLIKTKISSRIWRGVIVPQFLDTFKVRKLEGDSPPKTGHF